MSWLAGHVVLVLALAVAVPTGLVMLQQRRTPQSTLAWLLGLILVPYLAVPVFLMLGFRKDGKRFPQLAFERDDRRAGPATTLSDTFDCLGAPPPREGNAVTLLASGEAAHARLMALARDASETLDVMFYLIADDPVGRAFVEALTERARAGVRVRLVVDRLGGFSRPRRALSAFVAAGGQLRYFSPFVHRPTQGRLNLRNHRKIVVADDRVAFAGGMNVGADYLGPAPDAARFADLSFSVEGPVVHDYRTVFLSDWAATGKEASPTTVPRPQIPVVAGAARAQLVASGPDTPLDALHDGLVAAIHRADLRVWIVTPYFAPTEPLMQALTLAARRGVDVRCLVPRTSNHQIADFARGAYLRDLQAQGCRLLFHETRMVHAKAGVIDDAAWVGSANFDVRSMFLNFESALFLLDARHVAAVSDWFEALAASCGTGVAPAGPLRRLSEGVFRLGTPLL